MNYKKIISMVCLLAIAVEILPVQALNYAYAETRLEAQIGDSNEKTEEKVDSENQEKVEDSIIKQEVESEDNTVKQEVESEDNKITQEVKVEDNTIKEEVESGDSNTPNEGNESAEPTKILGSSLIRTYLGEAFDAKAGIKAIDSNGKDITDSVSIEGKVDTNKVGSYELKYSVKDESGKTATLTRKVNVINKNIFNTFIEKVNEQTKEKTKELGFSIYLDNNTSKFLVENQSKEKLDPAKKDEVVFKIRVIDKDNKEKLKVELLGDDTGDSEKLNPLKELEYSFGDYIEIHSTNAKNGFNIEGEMSGDIDTKKVKDEKNSENVKKEDYSDGVDNMDYLSNVRFKITEEGIETVYNNAPEISGLEPMEKLLTKRADQLAGVKVTDDHDKEILNDKIKISKEKDSENNVIGLRYEVVDSWGRIVSVLRDLKLKTSEKEKKEDQKPTTYNANTLTNNVIEVHGKEYSDNDTLRFKVIFNHNTKKIDLRDRDERLFDNKIKDDYFEITIYDKQGGIKRRLTINGSDKASSKKLDEFHNTTFEFGDQIALSHRYSESKLRIKGTISDATFNHQNGIESQYLEGFRFGLERDGLKYLTNSGPEITWDNQNLQITRGEKVDLLKDITVTDDHDGEINKSRVEVTPYDPNKLGSQTVTYSVTDSWGVQTTQERRITVVSETKLTNTSIDIMNSDGSQKAFSIKFDDFERKIKIEEKSNNQLDSANPNDLAFRIRIFSKAGITKKDISLNGSADGLNSALDELNNFRYSKSDTIELWSSNPRTGIKIIGDIEKDQKINEDYSDGIDKEDFMTNVRFELAEKVLIARYNDKPEIVFNDDFTIKRGEEFEVSRFVKEVKDDHDNLNIKLVKAKYDKDKFSDAGTHNVTFTVSDKWGRSTSVEKEITVLSKNALEDTSISLFKPDNAKTSKPILTLYFDDVQKVLRPVVEKNQYIPGEADSDVFTITILNENGTEKAKSTIKANETVDIESLSEVMSANIEYNDGIHISAYNHEKVAITGKVTSNHKNIIDYENGFGSDDKMKNTRFRVTEDGLKEVYNEAPELHGVEDTFVIKDGNFNNLDGVTITDDHDTSISEQDITVINFIDTSKVGEQKIIYKATDSWGRSIEKERTINVKAKTVENFIELKDSNDTLAFKIGIDLITNKFIVSDQSSTAINSSNSETEFFIAVADRNNEVVKQIEISGTEAVNASKISELNETTVRTDYKIYVWAKTPENLSIKGPINKDSQITEDDYADGVDNEDFIKNVGFTITEDGLVAVYNKAPEIILTTRESGKVSLYKGDDYRADLLTGVKVTDDRDTFTIEDIKEKMEITVQKSDEDKIKELDKITSIGDYEVTYTIKDSWGRISSEVKREMEIVPSIDRNKIILGGYQGKDIRMVFGLGFDSNTMTLTADQTDYKFHTSGFSDFYVVRVYHENGEVKYGPYSIHGNNRGNNSALNTLINQKFAYGDYITVEKAYQTFRISIDGPVRNGLEDYSAGIGLGDDFLYTKFIITEEGLKAEFDPIKPSDNETLIEFIGTEGRTPFKMKLNHETKAIEYPTTGGFYNYTGHANSKFKVTWHKSSSGQTQTFEHGYRETGVNSGLKTFLNGTFEEGDYINFEYDKIAEKISGVRITGSLIGEHKDYVNIIENRDDIKNVRFYLTANGIKPIYNYGTQFTGVDDINIYESDVATFEPRNGVNITHKIDENPTYTVTGPLNERGQSVTLNGIGKYIYKYTSTDSWGRVNVKERNVYVRPEIFKNQIELYPKEETSTLNNSNSPNQAEPLFRIKFDNDTGKYSVIDQVDKEINPDLGDEVAFKISVYNQSREKKGDIELNGTDRGTSEKLEELKNVEYSDGDYIRLWAADSQKLKIIGSITGDVGSNEDYSDGINNDDYMNNVAFKASYSGLETIYNDAPKINGLEDIKEVLFGNDVDFKEGVTVSDEEDNTISTDDIEIEGTVDKDNIGSYPVTYTVRDSWGRSTSKDVTFKVVSKMKENSIEVHGRSSTNADEHKFTLKFDINTNKIIVDRKTVTSSSQRATDKYFEIVVRARNTEEKIKVTLSQDESSWNEELAKLSTINYSNGDTISVYSNEKSNVRIKGNIEKNNGKNFVNGFDSSTEFEDVRFKVTNKGFELIERETLSITFDGDLSVLRGDESKLYEGIKIKYKNQDNLLGMKSQIRDFNVLELGRQSAKYVFTDSWGQDVEVYRNITVTERNNLEENKIKLLNSNDKKELLEFYIDTIDGNIVPTRSQNQYTGSVENLLTLNLYDESGVTKSTLTVTNRNLDSLQSIPYENGDSISISVYDKKKGLSIEGEIDDKKENYSDGVDEEDHIINVRFKIQGEDEGLKSIYNNAPILEVGEKLVLYKDESPDFFKGVRASDNDPHDTDISEADIEVDTELDVTHIGDYTANYSVADTWGRRTTKVRDIEVRSSLENNKIQYYEQKDSEPEFEISIDNINEKLKVTKRSSRLKNMFKNIFKQNNSNEKLFEVKLISNDGEVKNAITILENSTDIDDQLDNFSDTPYKYGDYISVYAKDHKDGVKIIGNIDKPLNITEDYSDGIDEVDFMNNVRIRIDEDGLDAVYNEAPKMEVLNPDEVIVAYIGDYHNYGDSIRVSDDHDINLSARDVRIAEKDKDKMNQVGTHTVNLIVTDSWGRSTQVQRKYNVKSSIDRNKIILGGYQGKDIRMVFGLGFDSNTMTFTGDQTEYQFHTSGFGDFYVVRVYHENGEVKYGPYSIHGNNRGNNSALNDLIDQEFAYGDYITVEKAYQTFRVSIDGPVRNELEDYSDNVNLGDDFLSTKFKITKAGLEAVFEPIELADHESLIEFIGTEGRTPFKIKLNHKTKAVEYPTTGGFYNYYGSPDSKFKVTWHKESSAETRTFEHGPQQTGVSQQLKDFIGNTFEEGDYIEFSYVNIPETIYGVRISGNLKVDESADEDLKNEDFSNGIQKKKNLTTTRFYLNEGGTEEMKVIRLKAPVINGAEDEEVLQNASFDRESGVTATDSDGTTDITSSMSITGNVDTSRIGLNEIKYEVRGSNGITTTIYRNINVYTTAEIALKESGTQVLEQGSIENTEHSIEEYLKSLVVAQDDESGGDISDRIKVTDHNLDPEHVGTYTASFSVTNDFGKTTTLENVQIEVTRTISVTVPTVIPFQVVTNLKDKTADPFIAGILKLQNNKTSDVRVSVESFTKKADSGDLEIVKPETVSDWDTMSEVDSMSKMALGMFVESGITGKIMHTRENPLWLENNMTNEILIGTLPRAVDVNTPYEARLSFTSKHGKNFIGGTARGKFDLVFKFE